MSEIKDKTSIKSELLDDLQIPEDLKDQQDSFDDFFKDLFDRWEK